MKKLMLNTLLAAGVLLCGAAASAADRVMLARHAQTLSGLASQMDEAFRNDLAEMHRYYGPSRAELRFRESLCQLSGIAEQFRRAVDRCAPACDLERGFGAMEEAFRCVQDCADGVRVCAEIGGMMRQFGQSMECVGAMSFEAVPTREPEHSHYHHQHGSIGYPQPSNGWFRVPLPSFRVPVH